MGDSAESPRFIETLPKRGYRFIASVENPRSAEGPAPAPDAPAAQRSEPLPEPARSATTRPRASVWWPAGAVLLLVAGAAGWFYTRRAAVLAEPNSVVLTEFENRTGDPAFDFTLKQALQIDLQQSPFLNILSDQQV